MQLNLLHEKTRQVLSDARSVPCSGITLFPSAQTTGDGKNVEKAFCMLWKQQDICEVKALGAQTLHDVFVNCPRCPLCSSNCPGAVQVRGRQQKPSDRQPRTRASHRDVAPMPQQNEFQDRRWGTVGLKDGSRGRALLHIKNTVSARSGRH